MFSNLAAHNLLLYMAFVQLFMFLAKVIVRLNSRFQRKWYSGSFVYLALIALGIALCFPLNQFISDSTQSGQNYQLLTMQFAVAFMFAFLVLDIGFDYISRDPSKQNKIEYLHPPKSTNTNRTIED